MLASILQLSSDYFGDFPVLIEGASLRRRPGWCNKGRPREGRPYSTCYKCVITLLRTPSSCSVALRINHSVYSGLFGEEQKYLRELITGSKA